jgi:hypothetical protein
MRPMLAGLVVSLFCFSGCMPGRTENSATPGLKEETPRLVVLVHGATEPPGRSPDPRPGTLDHAKNYWGYGFCSRLIGAYAADNGTLLPGSQPPPPPPPSPAALATRLRSFSGHTPTPGNWATAEVDERTPSHHFYAAGSESASKSLALMLTYLDGSQRLVPQARALIDQLYDRVHAQYTGDKPNLILVGHSMGGLVLRYLLTLPDDPISGQSLTASQRQKAQWIRNRTLYLLTLATPHEGSPLATKYQAIGNYVGDTVGFLKGVLRTVGFSDADPKAWMTQTIGLTPALGHLRPDFWSRVNQGPLAPDRMVRSDGSAIPVYAMGGRTPAGPYFSNPDHFPAGGLQFRQDMQRQFKAVGLMLLDWGLRNAPGSPRGWGGLVQTPEVNFDEVRRGNTELSLSGRRFVTPPAVVPLVNCDGLPFFYVGGQGDGEPDTDGMVSIASALGNRLGTNTNLYFDHRKAWKVGDKTVGGSWYRLASGPWNGANHDTIVHAPAIGDWIKRNLPD